MTVKLVLFPYAWLVK